MKILVVFFCSPLCVSNFASEFRRTHHTSIWLEGSVYSNDYIHSLIGRQITNGSSASTACIYNISACDLL